MTCLPLVEDPTYTGSCGASFLGGVIAFPASLFMAPLYQGDPATVDQRRRTALLVGGVMWGLGLYLLFGGKK